MANRSIKVRQVFAELRAALGDEIPAGELLRLSAAIVDASGEPSKTDEYTDTYDRYPFDSLPIDEVMSDGGWRLMVTERGFFSDDILDNDPRLATTKSRKINVKLAA